MSPYSAMLKDPRWQRKRLERLSASDFRCDVCCDETSTLNVHHKKYSRGRKPWEYDLEELETLCDTCHKAHHAGMDLFDAFLASENGAVLIGLCIGWLSAAEEINHSELATLLAVGNPKTIQAGRLARVSFDRMRTNNEPLSSEELSLLMDIAR